MLRSSWYLLLLMISIPAQADMMGGGMMGPSGSAEAPAKNTATATSRGYRLTQQFCVQCHQLPSPGLHSAGDWPAVLTRMIGHMRAQDMHFPNQHDEQLILEYLGHS